MTSSRAFAMIAGLIVLPAAGPQAGDESASASCVSAWVSTSPGDSNTLHDAVDHANRLGCTSGGMNEIRIDDSTHPVIAFPPPIPPLTRPACIGSGQIAGALTPDPNPGRVALFADLAGQSPPLSAPIPGRAVRA